MRKFLRLWFPAILYSGIIFYASSLPNVSIPLLEIQFDKMLHILVYALFGFLMARGIYGTNAAVTKKVFWIMIFGASLLYGASDEFHQTFVPGRNASLFDLLGDTVGGTIGGYIYLMCTGRN